LERELQSIRLSKGVLTIEQKTELRRKGCIRCRRSNEECIKREGKQLTIEHFPPKKLLEHWGLKDHPHFNWAICPSENSFYGGHLAHISIPDLPEVFRMTIRSTGDARAIAIAKLEVELRRFYRSIDSGQITVAIASATRATSVWRALLLEVDRAELKNLKGRRISVSKKHAKQMRTGLRGLPQSIPRGKP
jgi:hypothetical protein